MADAGMDVPALRNRPSLVGIEWLWEAYFALASCRQIGMVAGQIPWTAVEAYGRSENLDKDEMYLLHRVVQHIDSALADYHKEKKDGNN